MSPSGRRYERGNRTKHVGREPRPSIERLGNGEGVGKCPSDMSDERRQILLERAVGYLTESPYSAAFPKRLFAVDTDGTIYSAQTSNPGQSYHGFPYAGRMGKRLLRELRRMAETEGCLEAFDMWVKQHIDVGGPPDL